jgi:periplasmic divalent cation tolerance protein
MAMFQYDTNSDHGKALFCSLNRHHPPGAARMSAILAYITAPNRDEAMRIGKALLEARLAACINVFDGMRSAYWWQGRIEEADECVLIAKASASRQDAIIAKVKELHGYSVPCVICVPIAGGNPEYLGWIGKESGDA